MTDKGMREWALQELGLQENWRTVSNEELIDKLLSHQLEAIEREVEGLFVKYPEMSKAAQIGMNSVDREHLAINGKLEQVKAIIKKYKEGV